MTQPVNERVVRSFLDVFILSILNGRERHGYDIMRELKLRTGAVVGAGSLYPLLYEMQEKEFLTGRWVSETRRSRRLYRITEKGERFRAQTMREIERLVGNMRSPV